MPQAININGTTTRRPGVFATVDVSALSSITLDINRVAVIGSFPMLKQATPTEFSSAVDLASFDPSDSNVATVSKLLYRPSNDDRVQGGPSATILVSVNESTQAAATLVQLENKAQLVLKSKVYGLTGNRVSGNYDASTHTLNLQRDGITESFTDLEDTGYISIYYNGSAASSTTLQAGPVTGVKIEQKWSIDSSVKKDDGGNTITLNGAELNELAFDGTLKFTSVTHNTTNSAANGVKDVTIQIVGTAKASGLALTETLSFDKADATKTSSAFSAVSEIVISYFDDNTTDAAAVQESFDWYVENTAFDLPASAYPKLGGIFDAINQGSATHKYVVSSTNPKLSGIHTNTIDDLNYKAGTAGFDDIKGAGAAKVISRTLQNIIDTINNGSVLCTAERSTISEGTNVGISEPQTQQIQLAGGTKDGAESAADWELAINALKQENVQIIVPLTDDTNNIEVAKAVREHCKYMAGVGSSERCFWYGVPGAVVGNYTNLKAAPAVINSRHGAVVGQKVKVFDQLGVLRTLDPPYLALMLAGIQAGTGIAVPMTHKRVDAVDMVHPTWSSADKAEELIRNGLVVVTRDRLGFRVERSVTSYLTDDNPVFSEVSANESLNTCIRDLRNFVTTRIGDQNVNGTAQLVRTIAMTRLRQQVLDGIIKSFDAKSLAVVDLGDRLRIDARLAVVEPLNFIVINAEVVRNPS